LKPSKSLHFYKKKKKKKSLSGESFASKKNRLLEMAIIIADLAICSR
jgi:hypothetical protein